MIALIREGAVSFLGLAGIRGFPTVPLGTTCENGFCLPFEMNNFLCWSHTGSTHCPLATSARRCCNQWISRWHPPLSLECTKLLDQILFLSASRVRRSQQQMPEEQRAPEWEPLLRELPGASPHRCFAAPMPWSTWNPRQILQVLTPALQTLITDSWSKLSGPQFLCP